ncbi:Cthe_2314 family HEPN domain-containing protein [Chryseosolibacter indicus]|uniref:Cthe-2314-like HEPN domain-containing protein n=1 Tax=Chryseosolibacter indicus TaxID=2782351 RepID=A0ABS5VZN2_9BACT|nr:Cthe_2314 family HEPN domain-containing protein [Chryseosolibacter indicus]MBT1706538.1 hypothetical protein [Chryseosolibacter indicus]
MSYKDERHKIIWDFQREIVKIYEEQQLDSIEGLDRQFTVNGQNILALFFDTVRKGQVKYQGFDFHKSFDDICFCCDEIMYFTGQLYLYEPYLYNPLLYGYPFAGGILYPYSRTIENKRFNMAANTVSEKVYNYWDRIGDLLATYFPELIKPDKAYFTTTIDKIPDDFHDSPNYQWLKTFRDDEFKDLNEKRKQIVHYISVDTTFKWNHAKDPFDRAEIEKMLAEQKALPRYFKKHLELSVKGLEKTIGLIQEITDNRLADVE